ncbi:MAG: glycosyltransferase family 4 protein [Planctomycetaceae bacterium]|nr:glycosyltransferase family 4 protein [Planctomycetaceae bacterium]
MAELPQRVLMLTGELQFRGSSLLTLALARGLEEREVDTALVCTHVHHLDQSLLKGVRLHRVPGYPVPIWGRLILRTLYRDLKDQPPSVIHLMDSRLLPQAAWLADKLHCPLVVSIGDHREAERLYLRHAPQSLKAIIAVSESVKSHLPEGPRAAEIEQRVIYPGVSVGDSNLASALLNPDRDPVIGMAGPLEVVKGASFLLRACHRVLECGHQVRIIIAGSGPEEHSLRQLASSLQMTSRLTFVDGGTAMRAYLSAMDIYCLPSLQQGLGVMMLEAMALGRPVIASGVGGVLNVVSDNETGLIVPPSDSRSLADRICELLNAPDRAREIGLAGQDLIRSKFNAQRMTDEVLELYGEICRPAPRTVSVPLTAGRSRD